MKNLVKTATALLTRFAGKTARAFTFTKTAISLLGELYQAGKDLVAFLKSARKAPRGPGAPGPGPTPGGEPK